MQVKEALSKIRKFEKQIDMTPMGTQEFHEVSDKNEAFMYAHMFPRDYFFIAQHLDHQITNAEIASVVAASYNGEDISNVLDLSPEDKTLLKFQMARRKSGLTQQQVADKLGDFSQSQVAKAESGTTTISMNRWAELFRAVGATAVVKLG